MNINSNINNNIILIYNIDADKYNKKIADELNEDLNSIYTIFDSICIDVLIKLFIMYKREKKSKIKKLYEPYIKLILKLKKMEYINVKDYLLFVINILHIIKKKDKIEKYILLNYNDNKNNDDNYININHLNDTFTKIVNNIAKDNLIISKILDIHTNNNIDSIMQLSSILCSEFYYIYSAKEMYNVLKHVININSNKYEFIKNYIDVNEKLLYIYENDNYKIKNYKLECNKYFIFEILIKVKNILKEIKVKK